MINCFHQELFDDLYRHFFPDRINDIRIAKLACGKGAFSYALYNVSIVPYPLAKKWLTRIHRETNDPKNSLPS